MTLVVSEVSKFGITMVADSAVTIRDSLTKVVDGALKIQYSHSHNVGFAIWGHATINGEQLDRWLKRFIDTQLDDVESLNDIGEKLTDTLVKELRRENKPWEELVLGIHITGYISGLPRLWHIHCGNPGEVPSEPRLYKDFPEGRKWSDSEYKERLDSGEGFQFRNGYYEFFSLLFKNIDPLLKEFRERFSVILPRNSLDGRLSYYRALVRFVADILVAANERPSVNSDLSCLSMTDKGMFFDGLFEISQWLPKANTNASNTLWF